MEALWLFLESLDPAQQVGLAAVIASALMYLGRLVLPKLFASEMQMSKIKRALTAGLIALIASLAIGPPASFAAFLISWILAWAGATGFHIGASHITTAVRGR